MASASRLWLIAATSVAMLWGVFLLTGVGFLTDQWQANDMQYCRYFTAIGMDTRVSADMGPRCQRVWF